MSKAYFTLEWVLDFIAKRVNKLREGKGISAETMSLELGQNKAYINKIENKYAKPSIEGLYNICDYFGIDFKEFFDCEVDEIDVYLELLDAAKELDREQLQVLRDTARQFIKQNKNATPK